MCTELEKCFGLKATIGIGSRPQVTLDLATFEERYDFNRSLQASHVSKSRFEGING